MPRPSTTVAPGGTGVDSLGPAATIRVPRTTTVCPPRASESRPSTMLTSVMAMLGDSNVPSARGTHERAPASGSGDGSGARTCRVTENSVCGKNFVSRGDSGGRCSRRQSRRALRTRAHRGARSLPERVSRLPHGLLRVVTILTPRRARGATLQVCSPTRDARSQHRFPALRHGPSPELLRREIPRRRGLSQPGDAARAGRAARLTVGAATGDRPANVSRLVVAAARSVAPGTTRLASDRRYGSAPLPVAVAGVCTPPRSDREEAEQAAAGAPRRRHWARRVCVSRGAPAAERSGGDREVVARTERTSRQRGRAWTRRGSMAASPPFP